LAANQEIISGSSVDWHGSATRFSEKSTSCPTRASRGSNELNLRKLASLHKVYWFFHVFRLRLSMRSLVAILCLLAVIACPYECAVKRVAAQWAHAVPQAGCCEGCCTRQDDNSSEKDSPQPAAPEDDGIWCVCEGVIFDSSARTLLDDIAQVGLLPLSDPHLVTTPEADFGTAQVTEPPFAVLDSKSMRISLRSLQL
jgi:hypothetical protein